MSEFLYDVFVCHNSADKGEVDTIVSYLERQSAIRAWYDKYELRPGTAWQAFVNDEWPKIQSIAVFLGGRGIGAGQAHEIESLIPEAKPGKQFIVPVLLSSFDDRTGTIPDALQNLIYVDFRRPENKPLEQLTWAISGMNPEIQRSLGSYYRPTEGLQKYELRRALAAIIGADQRRLRYPQQVRKHISAIFEDPENPDNLIEFYSGRSIPKANHYGRAANRGAADVWSLEHIWPKAFGFAEDRAMVADLHNVVPAEFVKNAKKGAGFFSDPILDAEEKEMAMIPARSDDMRGAIARICLYMAVRYVDLLDLNEEKPVRGEPHIGSLRTLLYWNRLVDVTPAERRRNIDIAEAQGNRNPFIDEPEFATRIWYPV